MRIDDEMLMAFVDGELGGAEREAVERALQADPTLRDKIEAQRRLRVTLSDHYGPVASEEVPERLLAMLGATKAEHVTSLGAARERRKGSTSTWRNFGAIAATLAVGVLAGQLIPSRDGGQIGTANGVLVAEGGLAAALDTQLASAQAPNAPARIGISFEDREGRLCRTFDAAALSGLACNTNERWAVIMTAAREDRARTQYRQAGSSLVMQSAQEMMAGAPLDAAAERAAMKAEWKARR